MEPTYDRQPGKASEDYRMMTWETFLTVREWAQEVANIEGLTVYLVGSSLRKLYPRDIDIALTLPLGAFEARFGAIPNTEEELHAYLSHPGEVFQTKIPYWATLQMRIRWITRADVKVMPDTWHRNQDRLLLAQPGGLAQVREWGMLRRAKE